MEFQTLFNLVAGVGLSALGWALRTMYDDIKGLGRDLNDHKVEMARDYTKVTDFDRLDERINEKLDRIIDKLDSKADK